MEQITSHVIFGATFIVCAIQMRGMIQESKLKNDVNKISDGFICMEPVDEVVTYIEKVVETMDKSVGQHLVANVSKTSLGAQGSGQSARTSTAIPAMVVKLLLNTSSVIILIVLELLRIVFLIYFFIANIVYYLAVPTLIAYAMSTFTTILLHNISMDQRVTLVLSAVFTYGIGQYLVPTLLIVALQPYSQILFIFVLTLLFGCVVLKVNIFSDSSSRIFSAESLPE